MSSASCATTSADLLVQGPALFPERGEAVAVLCERAIGAAHPLPCGVDGDGYERGRRALAERPARALGEDRAAAEREHVRLAPLEHFADDLFLDASESPPRPAAKSSTTLEPVRRSISSSRSRKGRPIRSATSRERRLARAHEADERDVPLQRP